MGGGRGTSSGGNTNITAHKLPEKWKPNSSVTRYDKRKMKRERRFYDSNGEKWKDTHYMGPQIIIIHTTIIGLKMKMVIGNEHHIMEVKNEN